MRSFGAMMANLKSTKPELDLITDTDIHDFLLNLTTHARDSDGLSSDFDIYNCNPIPKVIDPELLDAIREYVFDVYPTISDIEKSKRIEMIYEAIVHFTTKY